MAQELEVKEQEQEKTKVEVVEKIEEQKVDPQEWGPDWWKVYHGISDNFPETANDEDTNKFEMAMHGVSHFLPCSVCSDHSKKHWAKNPPRPKTRREAQLLQCEHHNAASIASGHKEKVRNCQQYVDSQGVPDYEAMKEEALLRAKKANRDVINVYADADKVKRPDIIHAPCPAFPETSCVDYNDKKNVKLYLNPYTDSHRQGLHEYDHYRDVMTKGKPSSEDHAQDFAYQELNKVAPKLVADKSEIAPKPKPKLRYIARDTSDWLTLEKADLKRMGIVKAEATMNDTMKSIDGIARDKSSSPTARDKYMAKEFPLYYMIKTEEEERRRKEELEEKKKQGTGALAPLDPVYAAYAKMLGLQNVTPNQLNLVHTPQLVQNLVMTLVEANTTALGSVLTSLLFGGLFFGIGIIGRKKLVTNDQLMIQNFGASFFWRAMNFVNPKRGLKDSAMDTWKEVGKGKFSPGLLFETPHQEMKKKQKHMKEKIMALQAQSTAPTVQGGTPVAAPGGIAVVDDDSDPNAIATTTGSIPDQYQLVGDDYYDDTDAYNQYETGGLSPDYINPDIPRNAATGMPDISPTGGATSSYTRGWSDPDLEIDYGYQA